MDKIKGNRTDFNIEKKNIKLKDNIFTFKSNENGITYHTIYFPSNHNLINLKKDLIKELKYFCKLTSLPNNSHTLVVGLGNNNYTADSIGPEVLKHIRVNSYLEKLGIPLHSKMSALEPGVLSETGIGAKKIVTSVVREIKPDLVILIDSFVVENIKYLNHSIEITNEGITPGSGVKGINEEINSKNLKTPIIVIGVPTAIEISFKKNDSIYILSSNNIDDYIKKIGKVIGNAINEVFVKDEID